MSYGEHVLVERKKWFVNYYHHGIEIEDEQVIHLTGPRKSDAKVIQTSMAEFLSGGKKEVWEYVTFIDVLKRHHSDMAGEFGKPHWMLPSLDEHRIEEIQTRLNDPCKAVETAKKKLGQYGYNLITDNCEHFTVYCKTGLAVSLQIVEHQKHQDKVFKDVMNRDKWL